MYKSTTIPNTMSMTRVMLSLLNLLSLLSLLSRQVLECLSACVLVSLVFKFGSARCSKRKTKISMALPCACCQRRSKRTDTMLYYTETQPEGKYAAAASLPALTASGRYSQAAVAASVKACLRRLVGHRPPLAWLAIHQVLVLPDHLADAVPVVGPRLETHARL